MMLSSKQFRGLVLFAVVLAWMVVMLGAYTRLTDAGLGCPDWPGCYGQLVLPKQSAALQQAQAQYPGLPIEQPKAWTEMIHRYAAGSLALLILLIAFRTLLSVVKGKPGPRVLPFLLVILVVFQALLGMWTVTLKLLPVVVMSHLIGGMLIFACLVRLRVQLSTTPTTDKPLFHWLLGIGAVVLLGQIALGGWVSANYAGIACIGFPQCNGQWWPSLHFSEGFNLFSPLGINYQGGVLESEARASIQFVHRIGALFTFIYLGLLALAMMIRRPSATLVRGAVVLLLLLCLQLCLGVANVLYLLPLPVAVAHNAVAALLLATLFSLLHMTQKGRALDVDD